MKVAKGGWLLVVDGSGRGDNKVEVMARVVVELFVVAMMVLSGNGWW